MLMNFEKLASSFDESVFVCEMAWLGNNCYCYGYCVNCIVQIYNTVQLYIILLEELC